MKNILFGQSIFGIVLLWIGFTGCNPMKNTVLIQYEEIAVFSQYQFMPPEGDGKRNFLIDVGAYVVYKINAIENQSPGAKDFTLDPAKFYVVPDPKQSLPGAPFDAYSMTEPQLVPKDSTKNDLGRLILFVSGDRVEIMDGQNHLQYKSGAGESVIFKRNNVKKKVLDPATSRNLSAL